MNRTIKLFLAVLTLQLPLATVESVSASKIPDNVSGTVSTPSVGNEITLSGKTYSVSATAETERALAGIHVGDHVRVFFNGPPTDRASKVISIQPQTTVEGSSQP